VRKFLSLIAILFAALSAYHLIPRRVPAKTKEPLLIAHRGLHQNYRLDDLENDTCTARLIEPPRHPYLENTIAGMAAAFAAGADVVEFDIHPTTDHRLAIFHDWTLDCRTNGKGVTHEQTLAYLQSLDVGYGYTADDGRTFPFRGKGVGLMPSLDQVLAAFPDERLLIDQKDHDPRTIELLAKALNAFPESRRRQLFYWNDQKDFDALSARTNGIRRLLPSRPEMKRCAKAWLLHAGLGKLPSECRAGIGIPARYLGRIPGWPGLILQKARSANVPVYVFDVDTPDDVRAVKDLPLDGIVTNRIDVIASLLRPQASTTAH
jgi:glycerophosphoryl diester phosphodiesterase